MKSIIYNISTIELEEHMLKRVKCVEFKWNWKNLSYNNNLTWKVVEANLDKEWDWYGLSRNEKVATWEIVEANPDKHWNWFGLSENPSVTWDIVLNNPGRPWVYRGLSINPCVTWHIVQAYPDKPWDWDGVEQLLGFLLFLFKYLYIL